MKDSVVFSKKLPELLPGSCVESPVVIQAVLAPKTLVKIGGFTGVYGGKIGNCEIGRFCSIAGDVDIGSNQHPVEWMSTSMIQYVNDLHGWGEWLRSNGKGYQAPLKKFKSSKLTKIGNDVWVGKGVTIRAGVKVGDGAILAAKSVVLEDVPPYAIVAGVPAKIKRYRFSTSLIHKMLKVQWWNYNFLSYLDEIEFDVPENALDRIMELVNSREIGELELPKTPI